MKIYSLKFVLFKRKIIFKKFTCLSVYNSFEKTSFPYTFGLCKGKLKRGSFFVGSSE